MIVCEQFRFSFIFFKIGITLSFHFLLNECYSCFSVSAVTHELCRFYFSSGSFLLLLLDLLSFFWLARIFTKLI